MGKALPKLFHTIMIGCFTSVISTDVNASSINVGSLIGGIGSIMQNAEQIEMQKRQYEQQLELQRQLQLQQQQMRNTNSPNQPNLQPLTHSDVVSPPSSDVFIIDDHKIGSNLTFNELAKLNCRSSDQFTGFEWCLGSKDVGGVDTNMAILRSSSGGIAYYSKFYASALFKNGSVRSQIENYSRQFKVSANIETMPTPDDGGGAVIVTWGQVRLVKLSSDAIRALASGSPVHEGVLIDFLSNARASARRGLPVYRLSGGLGYYWAAQWDRNGKGVLRLGIADLSMVNKPSPDVPSAPLTAGVSAAAPAPVRLPDVDEAKSSAPSTPQPSTTVSSVVTASKVAPIEKSAASTAPVKVEIPSQERRVALVIGNSAYQSVRRLQNSIADAESVYNVLRGDGFDVKLLEDATLQQTRQAMRDFQAQADDADWAVLYYAGHGIEIGGKNYLVPVDAHLASDRDADDEGITLKYVLDKMQNARKLHLVILDACRDNPFAIAMKRSLATRGVTRGLAPYEPAAPTEIVVYSARGGEQAFDGDETSVHSPFAQALVNRLGTPRVEISKMFRLVTGDVLAATKGQQQPFVYGSIPGDEDFYFKTK